MGDELDLLIIGAYFGEGTRRGNGFSHFLLGLVAPPHERRLHGGAGLPLFYPFCKVRSPLSDLDLWDCGFVGCGILMDRAPSGALPSRSGVFDGFAFLLDQVGSGYSVARLEQLRLELAAGRQVARVRASSDL